MPLSAQSSEGGPLDGVNALVIEGGSGFVSSGVRDGVIPPVDPSITLGDLSGTTTSLGLYFERPMPSFFVSRGVTLRAGLFYRAYHQTIEGAGTVTLDDGAIPAYQRTTMSTELLSTSLALRIHTTAREARLIPTVDVGLSLGHLLSVSYQTESDPIFFPEGANDGFPGTGNVPDRRFFHGTIDLGVGMAIALGRPNRSIAIIPSIALHAAMGSLTKRRGEEITPFIVDGAIGIRLPLRGSSEPDEPEIHP